MVKSVWWDRLSLHIPIWVGLFVIGFKFGGGGAVDPEDIVIIETTVDLAWERCEQYGLNYWEAPNGFWNCRKV